MKDTKPAAFNINFPKPNFNADIAAPVETQVVATGGVIRIRHTIAWLSQDEKVVMLPQEQHNPKSNIAPGICARTMPDNSRTWLFHLGKSAPNNGGVQVAQASAWIWRIY